MIATEKKFQRFWLRASLLILVSSFALPAEVHGADGDFEKGTRLYAQKQFKPALTVFSSLYQADPKNLTALFYAANCLMAMGQSGEAIKAYNTIVSASPHSAAGIAADGALKSINANSSAIAVAKSNVGVHKMSDEKLPTAAAQYRANGAPGEFKSAKDILKGDSKTQEIDSLIKVVRAQADRPYVSADFIADTKSALGQYPTSLLHLLAKKNIHIKLTPTMVDNDPSLGYKQPRGYEDGKTYKNCPGLFNGYEIVLCEYEFIGESNDLRKCFGPMGTLRHELGHAVDRCLGTVTRQEEFRHRYLLDIGTIDDDMKSKLTYYLQKDRAGPSETFAEIMCNKYGGRPSSDSRRPEEVARAFKGTTAYIDSLIAALPAN